MTHGIGPIPLTRRSVLRWAALGAGTSTLLAACGSSDSGSSSTSASPAGSTGAAGSTSAAADLGAISIQLSWLKNIEFAGEYFATADGYYQAAGFSGVELVAGGAGGTSAESAVASGKAFMGLSSPTATAPAVAKGAPLKIVAATYQKNPFCILSLAKNPIAAPKDMLGKKIGVQQGTNDVIFKALLKANGISPGDVRIVPVQYDPTVVTTGEVDGFMAYITNEPILIKGKGFEPKTFLMADYGLPLVAETLTVRQESIDKERAKVKALLKAEVQGWKAAVADPARAADLAVNTFGKGSGLVLSEQVAEAKAQNDLVVSAETKANGLLTMSEALIAQNVEALGKVGTTITAAKLFDLSLLAEVYQENPTLKG